MANGKQKYQSTNNYSSKPFKSCLKLSHVLHFLCFAIGLAIGTLGCLYLQKFLTLPLITSQFINVYNLSFTSSFSLPPPLSPPSPLVNETSDSSSLLLVVTSSEALENETSNSPPPPSNPLVNESSNSTIEVVSVIQESLMQNISDNKSQNLSSSSSPPPPIIPLPLANNVTSNNSPPPPIIPFPSANATFNNSSDHAVLDKRVLLMHNMSDGELLSKASKIEITSDEELRKIVPKVAFMFLTHGPLPLAALWEKYFKGHEERYSIYVHPHPSHNDTWPETSVFFGRRVPSKPVTWGTGDMVDAERRLLANALLDISNQRFVLLSESCIPLVNFQTTYDYLMNSNASFLEIYDEPRKRCRGRYNPEMAPVINITNWRKGSQWFEVHRDLAVIIVSDQKYYKVFQDYCHEPCYMDEFYFQTFIFMKYPELSTNRTTTYVDWSRGGPHPARFGKNRISDEFLNSIRYGSHCFYNSKNTTNCYLFARKFAPDALDPLLKIAPIVLGFDP